MIVLLQLHCNRSLHLVKLRVFFTAIYFLNNNITSLTPPDTIVAWRFCVISIVTDCFIAGSSTYLLCYNIAFLGWQRRLSLRDYKNSHVPFFVSYHQLVHLLLRLLYRSHNRFCTLIILFTQPICQINFFSCPLYYLHNQFLSIYYKTSLPQPACLRNYLILSILFYSNYNI